MNLQKISDEELARLCNDVFAECLRRKKVLQKELGEICLEEKVLEELKEQKLPKEKLILKTKCPPELLSAMFKKGILGQDRKGNYFVA